MLLKIMNFDDSTALFEVFHGPRGAQHRVKLGLKAACDGNIAPRASQETPGLDFGAILGPCWLRKSVRRGVPNQAEF